MINEVIDVSKDILNDTVLDFALGSFVGLLGWFFGGLDGFVKMLITFAVIDYFSGLAAALWIKHNISSSIGFKGISKKILMFSFVGIAHVLDKYMLGEARVLKEVVCLFYIGNEGISIIENADKLGIVIPSLLRRKFLTMKEEQEKNKDEHDTDSDKITITDTKQKSK